MKSEQASALRRERAVYVHLTVNDEERTSKCLKKREGGIRAKHKETYENSIIDHRQRGTSTRNSVLRNRKAKNTHTDEA
jgi:hypothetical protein